MILIVSSESNVVRVAHGNTPDAAAAAAKRQKVGSIEREFFSPQEGVPITIESLRPVLTAVEDALRCIIAPDPSKGGTFKLERF